MARSHEAMRPSSPRSSSSSSTVARYSRSRLRVRPSTGTVSSRSSTSTRRRPWASVWAAPATPRPALQSARAGAAGEADPLGDAGDRADLGVLAVVTRHEQQALVAAGVDRKGDLHRREDDGVIEGDEEEGLSHEEEKLLRSSTVVRATW